MSACFALCTDLLVLPCGHQLVWVCRMLTTKMDVKVSALVMFKYHPLGPCHVGLSAVGLLNMIFMKTVVLMAACFCLNQ